MSFTTEISGVGAVQYTGAGYTNAALIQSFLTSLSQFYQLQTGSAPLTAADLVNIQNQVNFLSQIAQNGVSINLDTATPGNPLPDGSDPGTSQNVAYYLTPAMLQVLNSLFSSLAPGGNINDLTLTDLNNFRNGTATQVSNNIQNIFVYAAQQMAILPALSGSAPSTISLIPSVAAAQIARIYVPGKVFTGSTINSSVTVSEQSFTELDYVETANEVINTQLTNLQQALQTTQNTINDLTQLQQLHNDITVNSRTFTLNLLPPSSAPNTTLSTYVAKYEKYASTELQQALVPQLNSEFLPFSLPASAVTVTATAVGTGLSADWTLKVTINNPSQYYAFNTSTNSFVPVATSYSLSGYYVSSLSVNPATFTQAQMARIAGDGYNGVQQFPLLGTLSGLSTLKLQLTRERGSLSALLVSLSSATPASTLANPLERSQSLLGRVSTVYTDLVKNLSTITSTTSMSVAKKGIRSWIMDNYQTFSSPSATSAGLIQQNITNALTTAESTNTTQTTNVQNELLVFQQFYQSAAAVLTQLNQIIVKTAQNISK